MLDRFTDRARKVMSMAKQEALDLHSNKVGTEHLLLALAKEDEGIAAEALRSLDISYDDIMDTLKEVQTTVPEPSEETEAAKLLSRAAPLTPFTPHTETDAAALLASLPACREAGFAVENGEYKIGLRSISAPVFTGGGTLKYVVSVLGMFRSVHSDEFAHAERAVVAAGQMLSAALGYQG